MPVIPITGPAYDPDVPSNDNQRLVNWYLEQDPAGGKYPWILRPTPGLKSFSTNMTAGPIRGMFEHRDVLYVVAGSEFAKIGSDGSKTAVTSGTLNTTTGQVTIASNGDEIMIVDGTDGYIYDISTNTLSQIIDPDFVASPEYVTSQDGFFIVSATDSEKFYVSNFEDGSNWTASDFASANTQPDYVQALISDHQELWIFGTKTTEVWYNSGAVDFTFTRRPNVQLTKGLAARHTLAQADNSLYWLARDKTGQIIPVRAEGYTPKAISSPAIAHQISKLTTISDAIGYVHSEGQHEFYVLSFPTEGKTFVYDALTQQWHQRESLVSELTTCHRGSCFAYAHGKRLVGDLFSNAIFEYDNNTYTENGGELIRTRRTPIISSDNKLISLYNVIIDFEPGVGLESGQGSDPQIGLKVSKDGHTFGNTTYRTIGKTGEYGKRVKWDSLGVGRNWVLEVTVSDPVNVVIVGATADIEMGNV